MVVKKSNGCKKKKVVSDLPRATLKLESTKTIPSQWKLFLSKITQFSSVQSLSRVQLFATP